MSVENISYKGPICDTLGFRQHGANCATDTILQVLMFADGLKAKTQRTLYTITDEDIITRTRALFSDDESRSVIRYFQLIQERFRIHYDALQCELSMEEGCERLRNEISKTCPVHPLLQTKKRRSPELATLSKKAFAQNESNIDSVTGVHPGIVLRMIPLIFKWFHVPYLLFDNYNAKTTRGVFLMSDTYLPGQHTRSHASHFSAIYRCNDIWHYYTNERGIFKIPTQILPIVKEILCIYINDTVIYARHNGSHKIISVFIDNKEVTTPTVIHEYADIDGKIKSSLHFDAIADAFYCSHIPPALYVDPDTHDIVIDRVTNILGTTPYTPVKVQRAFQKVARTYGKPGTKPYTQIMNIGNGIIAQLDPLSRMRPSTHRTLKKSRKRHRGGYIPTPRNLHYLRLWKKHKSIGFTMRSSLKAKGLIPRANGTYRVSDKYKTRANRAKTHKKQSRKE